MAKQLTGDGNAYSKECSSKDPLHVSQLRVAGR